MDSYVTGTAIRQLREAKHMTQAELAEKLAVSAKAISKWETARGLPDISLLEPLAAALGVSVLELMQGEPVVNRNRSANLLRSKLYVCPLCGNVLHATGQAVVSCCGITLPPLDISEADDADEHHQLTLERVEDELFVTIHHPMTKDHYISFIACLTGDKLQLVKLYVARQFFCETRTEFLRKNSPFLRTKSETRSLASKATKTYRLLMQSSGEFNTPGGAVNPLLPLLFLPLLHAILGALFLGRQILGNRDDIHFRELLDVTLSVFHENGVDRDHILLNFHLFCPPSSFATLFSRAAFCSARLAISS